MKLFSIILFIAGFVSTAHHRFVAAHDDGSDEHYHDVVESHDDHHHSSENEFIHPHHLHHEHDHHEPDHLYRGLRHLEPSTPMVVGNYTYASKSEFIQSGHRCGSKMPSSKEIKASNAKISQWMTDSKHRMDQSTTVDIPTYVHIITSGKTGALSNATINSQMTVLNTWFNTYGFSFRLMKTTRTNNPAWYYADSGSKNALAMFTRLRVGGASTLNIYFSAPAAGLLGYAAFPMDYDDKPIEDGVVITSGSVPGGSITDYNQGKTLVHEVGHWLGLLHTFHTDHRSGNGCLGTGDIVNDTPRQRSATSGCPVRQDTCPRSSGLDMVSNFMDYSDDVCLVRFTTGQKDRMLAMWNTYRA